jgi:hypothetical protein
MMFLLLVGGKRICFTIKPLMDMALLAEESDGIQWGAVFSTKQTNPGQEDASMGSILES